MIDFDNVCFNIAAFVAALFVLEWGANRFLDNTAKVASRLRIPPTLVALLIAGAEWEEVNFPTPIPQFPRPISNPKEI
jgi:hypothetical protein